MNKDFDLPKPPEGYYWRYRTSELSSRFDKYELVKKRRWWFDQAVHHEYVDLVNRYPGASLSSINQAIAWITQLEDDNR